MDWLPDIIATERLVLRRPRLADAPDVFAYASDPEVTRLMTWRTPTDISQAVEFLAECGPNWERGDDFTWIITAKPDDRAIGALSTRVRKSAADLGYILNRKEWGKGYVTEAARAVADLLLAQPDMYRVWATCDTENHASAKVLEKCGLVLEGTLRRSAIRPNISDRPRDTFVFARVKE